MIKPIDALGFGPKREEYKMPDGNWRITVTPPAFTGLQRSIIYLNDDQYARYKRWLEEGTLIQEVFPELEAADREILLTGVGPVDYRRLYIDDEE